MPTRSSYRVSSTTTCPTRSRRWDGLSSCFAPVHPPSQLWSRLMRQDPSSADRERWRDAGDRVVRSCSRIGQREGGSVRPARPLDTAARRARTDRRRDPRPASRSVALSRSVAPSPSRSRESKAPPRARLPSVSAGARTHATAIARRSLVDHAIFVARIDSAKLRLC